MAFKDSDYEFIAPNNSEQIMRNEIDLPDAKHKIATKQFYHLPHIPCAQYRPAIKYSKTCCYACASCVTGSSTVTATPPSRTGVVLMLP
jgi:hypothetical protein